jgi:hypothetical protein
VKKMATLLKNSSIRCKNPNVLVYKNATNYTIFFLGFFAPWTFALGMFRFHIGIK